MIVPIGVRTPGIIPIQTVVIAITVLPVIVIQIIETAPHYPIMNLHPQVAIIIVFVDVLVFGLIIFFYPHIFISLTLGRIINIIGSLTAFVS
jgi:hypothetical protein